MTQKDLLYIYTDYLISQTKYATATGLEALLEGELSHDRISRFLKQYKFGAKDLWKYIKPEVRKFEKDHRRVVEYEFIRSFPISISSMPVSYDASSLLKCSVSFSYIRYVVYPTSAPDQMGSFNPFQQSQFNTGGLRGIMGNLADAAVTTVTGNNFLGDVAGAATRILL